MTDPVDVGVNYLTIQEIRDLLKIRDTDDDAKLELAIPAASMSIENICGRRFWQDTTPVARVYPTPQGVWLETEDFDPNQAVTVKTDDAGTGTFGTTWASTDYELGPFNPLADGPGAYHQIWPVARWWPIPYQSYRPYQWGPYSAMSSMSQAPAWYMNLLGSAARRRGVIQVTATWGWSSVPPEIKYAAALATLDLSKGPDAPFGVAGSNDFGVLRVRENQQVMMLIDPYIKKVYAS